MGAEREKNKDSKEKYIPKENKDKELGQLSSEFNEIIHEFTILDGIHKLELIQKVLLITIVNGLLIWLIKSIWMCL